MANISKVKSKPIEIELDKKRHLRYTLGSFAYLEETYGDIDKAFTKMEQGSMNAIIDIIYAGLIHEDANLTKHQVSHMIDISNMNEIVEQITKAMGNDVNGTTTNPN